MAERHPQQKGVFKMADEQDKQDIRDQANRIFQHGLYEDSALTERSNYFLIAESMLVVAYTGLISSASAAGATDKYYLGCSHSGVLWIIANNSLGVRQSKTMVCDSTSTRKVARVST
jgi:hypothetical protein